MEPRQHLGLLIIVILVSFTIEFFDFLVKFNNPLKRRSFNFVGVLLFALMVYIAIELFYFTYKYFIA